MVTRIRKHAAIMFTDIAGYTALMGSDEDRAFEVLSRNRDIHTKHIEQFNGTLIKEIGDGMLISFNLASDAVRCAIEIQKACKDQEIPLKIGIHEGEMVFAGSDVHGDGVNIASRIQNFTEGGGISISDSVYRDVKNKAGIDIEFMEEMTFKNVNEPIKIYKVLCDEVRTVVQSSANVEVPTSEKKSIAVLPFADMSPGKDQEYFAEGIAEELLNALAHIEDLRVVARTSAFVLKGMNLDIREIGRKLNVKTVLEGSVRKAGNRLRITAQLINVEDGFHLWSERYDRDMADIFAIQDEITAAIVDSLNVTLKVGEKTAIRKRSTEDPEAYSLYLKGLYFYARPSPESYEKALGFFQAAIDKDPSFAQPYAGMAQIFVGLGIYNFAPPADILPKAKAALQKALSLDENLAEAHAAAGMLAHWLEWDWEAAGRRYDRALALNPGDAMTHAHRGWFLVTIRRPDEAVRAIKKAILLDPLMPLYYAWSVGIHTDVGRYDEALQEFARAMEIDPDFGLAYWHVARSYFLKGLSDEALATLKESSRLFVIPGWTEGLLAGIYHLKGDRKRVERILEEMIETRKTIKQTSAYCIAMVAGFLGKLDLAFEFLDRAYEERDILMTLIRNQAGIHFTSLTADPRFKALLARMKLDFIPSSKGNSTG